MRKYAPKSGNPQSGEGRLLKNGWTRGVRGCFVCGKEHSANGEHPRDEVMATMTRLKSKPPSAKFSVADMDAVCRMSETPTGDTTSENSVSDNGAQWAIKDTDGGGLFEFVTAHKAVDLENQFPNVSFLYGEQNSNHKSVSLPLDARSKCNEKA